MPRRARRSVLLISMAASSLRRITVDAVIGLNIRRVRLIARLALLVSRLAVCRRFLDSPPRCSGCNAGADAECAKDVAPSNLFFRLHCAHPLLPTGACWTVPIL